MSAVKPTELQLCLSPFKQQHYTAPHTETGMSSCTFIRSLDWMKRQINWLQ